MENKNKIKIFLVDEDAFFLKSLENELLRHADFTIETFATGELCMKNLSQNPDVIILDNHLDGIDKKAMNGIASLAKIKSFNPDISVIMLSSQDKIDEAINSMQHRAFDYVVKSNTTFACLQKIISTIFSYKKREKELSWYFNSGATIDGRSIFPFQAAEAGTGSLDNL